MCCSQQTQVLTADPGISGLSCISRQSSLSCWHGCSFHAGGMWIPLRQAVQLLAEVLHLHGHDLRALRVQQLPHCGTLLQMRTTFSPVLQCTARAQPDTSTCAGLVALAEGLPAGRPCTPEPQALTATAAARSVRAARQQQAVVGPCSLISQLSNVTSPGWILVRSVHHLS